MFKLFLKLKVSSQLTVVLKKKRKELIKELMKKIIR